MFIFLNLLFYGLLFSCSVFLYPFAMSLTKNYSESFYKIIKGCFKKEYFNLKALYTGVGLFIITVAIQYMYFRHFLIFNYTSLFILLFLFLIATACIIDLKKNIIPDLITYPLILFGFCGAILDSYFVSMPYDSAIAALIGYFLPGIIGVIFEMFGKKQTVGAGDVKFLAGIGAWLGTNGLFYTVMSACIIGIVWLLVSKKKFLPFAPFCGAGVLIYLLAFLN